jgi:DNA-binding MurR/RpiR family transcriptional regulator
MKKAMPAALSAAAPRNFEELRATLVSRAPDLPKRLAQVARLALSSPDEIALGTAASVAHSASVQPSTLVRFAQAFGYSGFSALQKTFRDRLRERPLSYEDRLHVLLEAVAPGTRGEAQVRAVFDGFVEASQVSVRRLAEDTDRGKLAAAVRLLARAETLYLVGAGRSAAAIASLAYVLGKLHIKNMLANTTETASFATPKDAVLALSFSPYAATAVALGQELHAAKVPMVAVTDGPFSPFIALSKISFEVNEADFHGFRSMAGTLALLTTLAVATAELRTKPHP